MLLILLYVYLYCKIIFLIRSLIYEKKGAKKKLIKLLVLHSARVNRRTTSVQTAKIAAITKIISLYRNDTFNS